MIRVPFVMYYTFIHFRKLHKSCCYHLSVTTCTLIFHCQKGVANTVLFVPFFCTIHLFTSGNWMHHVCYNLNLTTCTVNILLPKKCCRHSWLLGRTTCTGNHIYYQKLSRLTILDFLLDVRLVKILHRFFLKCNLKQWSELVTCKQRFTHCTKTCYY